MSALTSKKAAGTPVTDYFMSMHLGLCYGPVEALLYINVKEKRAWTGLLYHEGGAFIDKGDLFGGNKKEGGVRGIAYWMPGTLTQVLPEGLARRLGLTRATAPGFRGYASLWFVGGGVNVGPSKKYRGYGGGGFGALMGFPGAADTDANGNSIGGPESVGGGGGFMWSTNNPYQPTFSIGVFCRPVGMDLTYSAINNPKTSLPDVNPIHIIYECMSNTEWGLGAPASSFNQAMYQAAAVTLFNEKFMMSLQWVNQTTIEAFVQEVLDHIQAVMYVNPANGLFEIVLIRGGYSTENLRVFNEDNCELTNFQRKTSELVNEIVVTWTNPENEEEETVTAQSLAGIEMQGQVISASRNYYGVRSADLAVQLAHRDLRAASSPLVGGEIEVLREGWNLTPGSVVKLSWEDEGIVEMIMRVGKIDYGKMGQPTIKVSLLQDIFAEPLSAYYTPPASLWVDPSTDPTPITYSEVFTAPGPLMQKAGLSIAAENYGSVRSLVLGAHVNSDVVSFELSGYLPDGDGGEEWGPLGTFNTTSHAFLTGALAAEPESALAFAGVIGGIAGGPREDGYVLIGSTTDESMEVAYLVSYNGFDEDLWTLRRGIYDTIPRVWPAGTPLWFITANDAVVDPLERTPGVVEYKIQPRATNGLLPLELADTLTETLGDRAYLPFRPANVSVGGVSFGTKTYLSLPTVVPVTWSNRNRTMEDVIVRAWGEAGVPVETGQTTTISIYDTATDALVAEIIGVQGESYDIPVADFGITYDARVEVGSERDGLDSLQAMAVRVILPPPGGYGLSYGNSYGG